MEDCKPAKSPIDSSIESTELKETKDEENVFPTEKQLAA